MIAVIVPYFQRQAGILQKALTSIAEQRACPEPVRVLVVDDESPVPAESELAGVHWPPGMSAQVLQRKNGGPGAARNTGLDAAGDARFVAFLDSDDTWSPDHLARAIWALDQGYDFYFADLYQLGQSVGAFERAGRIVGAQHPTLAGPYPDLHAYVGDMFEQINFGNVVATPTVVYRFAGFPEIRFLDQFRSAGEDYLFWIALTMAGAKIAFSAQVEATCGRGVNVYSGVTWGSPEHLRRVHDEMRYRQHVLSAYSLNENQSRRLGEHVQRLKREFSSSLLSLLIRRQPLPRDLLSRHLRHDPWALARLPVALARKLLPHTQ